MDLIQPGCSAESIRYFATPKILIEQFRDVSLESKWLYTILLDRMQLSARPENKGKYSDDRGVFVLWRYSDIADYLGISLKSVTRKMKELKKAGLVVVVTTKEWRNRNKIYLANVASAAEPVDNSKKEEKTEPVDNFKKEESNGQDKKSTPTISTVSEVKNDNHGQDKKSLPTAGQKVPPYDRTKSPADIINETDKKEPYQTTRREEAGLFDKFKKNTAVDITMKDMTADKMAIYRCIVEVAKQTIQSGQEFFMIDNKKVPKKDVVDKLLTLDQFHIDYVYDQIEKANQKIHNIPGYLRAVMYNAPDNLEVYVQNQLKALEVI